MAELPGTAEKKEGAIMPMAPNMVLDPVKDLTARRPKWLTDDQDSEARKGVAEFMKVISENPTDIRLTTQVYKLGEDGARELMPHTKLYERKIAGIVADNQDGSPTNKSLLQLKQELDQINPAILAKQPISVRAFVFLKKARLPKAQEVLDMIYAKRETVESTVNGIKVSLWETRDRLMGNLNDIAVIYEGLLKGQRMIERDIYFGQLLHEELRKMVDGMEEGIAKQNLEQVLADLTTQVINLQTEETANELFFAGSQNLAKLTNMQVANINGITRIMERSILANLGLRVVSAELAASITATEQLKRTIGETLADTAHQINESTDKMIEARSNALINVDSLSKACTEMEEVFRKQAAANKMIIEAGMDTSKKLSDMTAKLRERVEGGHEKMLSGATGGK